MHARYWATCRLQRNRSAVIFRRHEVPAEERLDECPFPTLAYAYEISTW